MDKKFQIIAIVGAIVFSAFVLTSPSDPIPLPEPTSSSENDFVTILAENLDKPRAIAVSDDRIFVTEKDGFIRVIENNIMLESPLAALRSADVFDGGLLGIAIHPEFALTGLTPVPESKYPGLKRVHHRQSRKASHSLIS